MSYCPSQDWDREVDRQEQAEMDRVMDELTMLAEQFYKGDPEAAFEEAARFIAVRESLRYTSTEWAKAFWAKFY